MTILDALKEVRRSGDGWTAKCPGHDDTHRSLSVSHRDGKWLLKCHAGCTIEQITAAMGIKISDLFDADSRKRKANGKAKFIAEYIYRTATGELSRKVCRTADKGFPQFRWTGSAWQSGTEGVPILPYRLPELVAAGRRDSDLHLRGREGLRSPRHARLHRHHESNGRRQVARRAEQVVCRSAGVRHSRQR